MGDQNTFKMTLMESHMNQRTRYEAFLVKVPILAELSKTEMSSIADALKSVEYKKGEDVITQGEDGNDFYIIEKGTVNYLKNGDVVGRDESGGIFGEIALLTNEKRAVTVKCTTNCTLLKLDRKTFVRVMGPMEAILKRNMATYKNYAPSE